MVILKTSFLSTTKCTFIIIANQVGSAVLTMPGLTSQLGWISFPMVLLFLCLLNMYCVLLAIFAFDKVLKETKAPHESDELQRHPLKVYCRHAFGSNSFLTTLVTILQTLCHCTLGVIAMLVVSGTLQTLIDLPFDISTPNKNRIWLVIVFFILLLPSMISSYREFGQIGFIATLAIILAELVIILSSIYIATLTISIDQKNVDLIRTKQIWFNYNPAQIIFSSLGTMNLALCGYMITNPNLSVDVSDTDTLLKATFYATALVYVLYLIAGWVPYFLLREFTIDTSVVTTILRISNEYDGGNLLNVMTKSVAVFIIVHFLLSFVIALNPIYVKAEQMLQIENEFSMKRVALRGSILLGLTIFDLIFPMFSKMVSFMGGGVIMLYSTIVPIALYFKLCESTLWTKCFGWFYVFVSLVLVFGINIVEIMSFL